MDAGSTFILTGVFIFAIWFIGAIVNFSVPFAPFFLTLLIIVGGILIGDKVGERTADKLDIKNRDKREFIVTCGILWGMAIAMIPAVIFYNFFAPRYDVGSFGHEQMEEICKDTNPRTQRTFAKTCDYFETLK